MFRATLILIAAIAAFGGPALAGAQGGHGSHPADGSAMAAHHRMQAGQDEMDRVIRLGLGAGIAFAADQNGYPRPLHVLELKSALGLTADQEQHMLGLLAAMFEASRPAGVRLLEAEARLRKVFADGRADEAGVRELVADVERARTELRLVHLLMPLRTRPLLTEGQRRLYRKARWGS